MPLNAMATTSSARVNPDERLVNNFMGLTSLKSLQVSLPQGEEKVLTFGILCSDIIDKRIILCGIKGR